MITKYDLTKATVARALRMLCRPVVSGLDRLPETGPVIIASNHLSFLDSVIISAFMPRRVKFIAKAEYVNSPGIKGRFMREAFEFIDIIPVARGQQSESVAALQPAVEHLREGKVFGIYPEGTRSPDGKLYRGRTGLARMALEARVPVIPVVMVDTGEIMPIGKTIPRIGRVGMVIGEPLDFSRFHGMESDRYVLRSVTDEIMVALQRLGEQQYEDVYASTVKDRAAAVAAGTA